MILAAPRLLGRLALPALLLGALIAVVAAASWTGAVAPQVLGDPGAAVRYGLPIVKAVHNLSLAVTIGALLFAVGVLPRTPLRRRGAEEGELDPAWSAALRLAAASSMVWTVAAAGTTILLYLDTAGQQALQPGAFSMGLSSFLFDIETGRAWLVVMLLAALVSILVVAVGSYTGVGLTLVLALISLVPQALTGHASGSDGHAMAVNSIGLHLLGVVAWLGTVVLLAVLAGRLSERTDLPAIMRRVSSLALFGFVLVVISGLASASLRVATLGDLVTPYGQLLVTKIVLAVILGAIGAWHRSSVIARLGEAGAAVKVLLWRLIGVEVVIFGVVSGVAVALARTAPPIPEQEPVEPTPARLLTGEELPPQPEPMVALTEWRPDLFWIMIAVFASYAYIAGVIALRKRGDSWPVLRLLCWLLGMGLLVYVTSGAPAVYGMVLFSGHMIQHMLLVMVVPIPLVLAAPITLLMRAVPPRRDGSRGPREWILAIVHSRFAKVLSNPVVAAVNFAGSLVVFYYSGLMYLALDTHLGHEIMVAHFLVAGYLFAQALIGVDPGVQQFGYPIRLLLLLITMAFHAFFGISIMSSTALIEPDWYGNIGHGWVSAIDDQHTGGEIAWGIGEIPALVLAIGVAVLWTRDSRREAQRSDRREDASEDAELRAYNAMLAGLSGGRGGASSSGAASGGAASGGAASGETASGGAPVATASAEPVVESEHAAETDSESADLAADGGGEDGEPTASDPDSAGVEGIAVSDEDEGGKPTA